MLTKISFHGPWTVEVISRNAQFDIRYDIRAAPGAGGAVGSGVFAGTVGTSTKVTGPHWQLWFEWTPFNSINWHGCEAQKLAATFLPDLGLVVTVGARRDVVADANQPFDRLVVRLRNTDPVLNPFIPIPDKPDFTYPHAVKTPPRGPTGAPVRKPIIPAPKRTG